MSSIISSKEERDFIANFNKKPKIHSSVFIAKNSNVIGNVEIAEDSSVWFNCLLRGDGNYIKIGKRTNIQDGTIVHIDSKKYPTDIGDDVTIGHGCIIHATTIRSAVLVGMGAIVLDGSEIESNVIVGAGSLVPPGSLLESGSLYIGSPCKRIRSINENDYKMIINTSKDYVHHAKVYKKEYGICSS
jgi:carbonic anhydrase/acetyltransferase-like protein (isoleucine patch superfamily)